MQNCADTEQKKFPVFPEFFDKQPLFNQLAKFGDLMSCCSKDIFKNATCFMY